VRSLTVAAALLTAGLVATSVVQPRQAAAGDLRDTLRNGEKAFRRTLLSLYSGGFVDRNTGLPYDTVNWNTSSSADESISGNDLCEEFTPFWVYMLATGDPRIQSIVRRVMRAYVTYLDTGTGFVGNYHFDTLTGELSPGFNEDLSGDSWAVDGRLLVDAEHGAEGALYATFPASWYFKDQRTIRSLEGYAENLLSLNDDPRFVHFHMYYGNAYDTWQVADWNGRPGYWFDSSLWVKASPQAYADLMEFWWILPALGCAVVTESEHLRDRITNRVGRVMQNIVERQGPDGRVDFVYRMDGSFSNFSRGYAVEPTIYSYQNWLRACYFMDHLTDDSRYVDSAGRFLRWYVENDMPTDNPENLVSFLVFHYFYTGQGEFLDLAKRVVEGLEEPSGGSALVSCAVSHAILYSATGDEEELRKALRAEARLRQSCYRRICSKRVYMLDEEIKAARNISHWDVDLFRGRISGVFFCAEKGKEAKGLVDRNLLLLGWLLDPSVLKPREGVPLVPATLLFAAAAVAFALWKRPRRKTSKAKPKAPRDVSVECKGFEDIQKCYRCRYYTASGGKEFCSKFLIELKT